MRKSFLAAIAAITLALPLGANSAEEGPALVEQKWSFNGILGHYDKQQLQRGFQVYKEVCANCHALQYIAFRNFEELGYSEGQVKAIAAGYQIEDGPDDNGDMFKRKGKPSDYFPKPFPNDPIAKAANNGALPPDLSIMAKARHGGPDYIYNLLLGYEETPKDVTLPPGMSYNKFFPGHAIGMPQQITDGKVSYEDGTKNDAKQIAADITAFLMWTAEPGMGERHSAGLRILLYTLLFTVLAFALKRSIWRNVPH